MSSKYAFGITFIVEKVHRMSIFVLYSNVNFVRVIEKLVINLLVSWINKKQDGLVKKV